MKQVFVLRHGQAANSFLQSDKKRILTEKGIVNNEQIAQKLHAAQIKFDTILCSAATRTKQTLVSFIKILEFDADIIRYKDELYHAPLNEYYKQIKGLPDATNTVLIVAHNPGITDFVNSLGIVRLDNMPTSGLFGFVINTQNWTEIDNAQKQFMMFEQPEICPNQL